MNTMVLIASGCAVIFMAISRYRCRRAFIGLLWYMMENEYEDPTLEELKEGYRKFRRAKRILPPYLKPTAKEKAAMESGSTKK